MSPASFGSLVIGWREIPPKKLSSSSKAAVATGYHCEFSWWEAAAMCAPREIQSSRTTSPNVKSRSSLATRELADKIIIEIEAKFFSGLLDHHLISTRWKPCAITSSDLI